MSRSLCIHGHFYQPPRENPWLEAVEYQESAAPYHDWNDRITAECYEPNTAARILNGEGRIRKIVNNYAEISFNFGPSLLSWLEKRHPVTYRAILDADHLSRERFAGHGAAMAQAYNHLIMPLANRRDKRSQILWGLADFRHRFGREPEGMWLPETAVDLETLDLMAEQGLRFTLLAPSQAARVRPLGDKHWTAVAGERIDPRMPYRCNLPSGRTIDLFFYDGPISRDVGFSDLLASGDRLARRLVDTFAERPRPQLVHIATDGETYGHHRRFGDMALAYCLEFIDRNELAELTIYGKFLADHPPTHEVEIIEKTSWSCAHGVERWRSDCGCNSGMNPGWSQAWRRPLRTSLDWLRDQLASLFEREAKALLTDPWQARDEYIAVILDRSEDHVRAFLTRHAGRTLPPADEVKALKLLEMQRHAMLMYTSCGWFFDDVSGIETTQILSYAARAIQLAGDTTGARLEEPFLRRLAKAPSNHADPANGAEAYRRVVTPARIDLMRVAAHHAIATLFNHRDEQDRIYFYTVERLAYETVPAGKMKLAIGHTRIRSEITWEEGEFCFAVLHLGGHNLSAGIHPFQNEAAFAAMATAIRAAFERSDLPAVIRVMDSHFGGHTYTLWHLFRDEQRKVLDLVMAKTLGEIEDALGEIYQNNAALMRFLSELQMPIPRQLALPFELSVNARIRRLLDDKEIDTGALAAIFHETRRLGRPLDQADIGFAAARRVREAMEQLEVEPLDRDRLEELNGLLATLAELPVEMDLWKPQNIFYGLWHRRVPEQERRAAAGDGEAAAWLAAFRNLGRHLHVGVHG